MSWYANINQVTSGYLALRKITMLIDNKLNKPIYYIVTYLLRYYFMGHFLSKEYGENFLTPKTDIRAICWGLDK